MGYPTFDYRMRAYFSLKDLLHYTLYLPHGPVTPAAWSRHTCRMVSSHRRHGSVTPVAWFCHTFRMVPHNKVFWIGQTTPVTGHHLFLTDWQFFRAKQPLQITLSVFRSSNRPSNETAPRTLCHRHS